MPTHFSLDIETLDTATTAVVLSIGICKFNEGIIGPRKHVALDITPQAMKGRTISTDTFHWWVKQLIEMGNNPFPDPVLSPADALDEIKNFIHENTDLATMANCYMWVRGPHFDWAILDSLSRDFVSATPEGPLWLPVKYSHVRDQRTYCAGHEYEPSELHDGQPHNAVADAVHQARFIQQVARRRNEDLC